MMDMTGMKQNKYIIGVTGGVGAGKSAILSYLESAYQARILMADEIAKQILMPGKLLLRKLQSLFLRFVFDPHGNILRRKWQIIFFNIRICVFARISWFFRWSKRRYAVKLKPD